MNKTCIIIAGPTAVGKTAFAIEAARHFSTEIISADSRQCYREMNTGVARPSPEELAAVPHHFIASHSIHENINAADFEKYALQCTGTVFQQHDHVVMVGGTGLYIKAFCEGLDDIPAATTALRQEITAAYEANGIGWLQSVIEKEDPVFFVRGEMQNPQRMMRALEVIRTTGRSILEFRSENKKQRPFNVVKIGLELPRDILYDRINQRVDTMIQEGLVEEARALFPYRHLNALQTVGYRELFDHFEGHISFERAVELIKQNTRHYAKRQLTWFKRDAAIQWLDPSTGKTSWEQLIQQKTG
ncbi:MAG: tRNA (adenosine(37)-N6)-dimethylallyltransferase MiaA [Ferruginibacter sp.]